MQNSIFDFRLRNAPISAKMLVLGFLFSLSLAYLYAILNIAMVVGWTPKDIAVHYYGAAKVYEVTPLPEPSGEQELDLDAITSTKPVDELGPRPSFKALVQEGHFHLFGMTSFFFCLTVLGLFTGLSEKWKATLVVTPYICIVVDNISFMATRFLGPNFAYLTALSGALMGFSFIALWFCVGCEVIKRSIFSEQTRIL